MQSHQSQETIWFVSPLEEVKSPLKFERREENFTNGGSKYEYVAVATALPKRKKINKENHLKDLMNTFNKTIKAYYQISYKDVEKVYIEPFFRAKKSLFILESDVEKLKNEMPSIFSKAPTAPPVKVVETNPIQETQQTSINSKDQSSSDDIFLPSETIFEFDNNSTNEPQQSHKYQNEICFRFPLRKTNDLSLTNSTEKYSFKLKLNDNLKCLEYEFEKKGSLTNKIHYDLARRFNSFIKSYYLKHYKDEKYLEPFKNYSNALLISPIDVEVLLNKIPQIFCSYGEDEFESYQSQPSPSTLSIGARIENENPCISNVDFLNLNPIIAGTTESKQYKRKLNRVPPDINKEDVEMMVRKFQKEQCAQEEIIPQELINKERIQEILENNNSIASLAEIHQENIDELLQDFEHKKNLDTKEGYTYVQLIKEFPQCSFPRKRKQYEINTREPIEKISKKEVNQRSEEVIKFIEQSIQLNPQTDCLNVLANSQIQNPYHFFAEQPLTTQSEIEERDVMKELSEFLQQEENAQQENDDFFNFDVNL